MSFQLVGGDFKVKKMAYFVANLLAAVTASKHFGSHLKASCTCLLVVFPHSSTANISSSWMFAGCLLPMADLSSLTFLH